jgi:hypothetical protein
MKWPILLKTLMSSGLQSGREVPLQVVDFSPVITILHVFSTHFSARHG